MIKEANLDPFFGGVGGRVQALPIGCGVGGKNKLVKQQPTISVGKF